MPKASATSASEGLRSNGFPATITSGMSAAVKPKFRSSVSARGSDSTSIQVTAHRLRASMSRIARVDSLYREPITFGPVPRRSSSEWRSRNARMTISLSVMSSPMTVRN